MRMIRVVIEFKGSEMVEYDENGKKVYEGKWFGNMRSGFLSHERMEGMSGYFKEVDSSGQLISVSGRRRWLCEWQIFRVFSRSSWEVKCSSMFIR